MKPHYTKEEIFKILLEMLPFLARHQRKELMDKLESSAPQYQTVLEQNREHMD